MLKKGGKWGNAEIIQKCADSNTGRAAVLSYLKNTGLTKKTWRLSE